jgi:DNA-binding protein HU-beta
MNKFDLINILSDTSGITKSQANITLEKFINIISTLEEGDKVTLMGFGTFSKTSKNKTRFKPSKKSNQ